MTFALLFAISSIAFTQTPSPTSAEPLTAKVDRLFAQWDKPDTPGCALAIIKNGEIIYKRGYGMASLELDVPITTTSVFNVGSIAKQFTAMAILMLAEQGKLSLDDDVRKYVAEVPDFGTPITLRHLILHTSGLRDQNEMLEMAGWRSTDVHTEKDVLDMVSRQRTLNHKPGDEFVYTNTGYTLLAVVVRRVVGQPLRDFAETNLFKPLGMSNTHIHDDHRTIIKRSVDGYAPKPGGGFIKWMPADDLSGPANLFTTVEDLARWDQNFYDKKVGGTAVIERLLTAGSLNNGEKLSYAHGLFIEPYKGLRTITQSGARLGFRAVLTSFPEQRFSVACLCNVRAIIPDVMAWGVADIYLADQLKQVTVSRDSPLAAPANIVKMSEQELSRVTGLYLNPVNNTIQRVYIKEGKLMFLRAKDNESELAPLGQNRFLMLGVRNRIEIAFTSPRHDAPMQMFVTVDGGKPSVREPVKPASYEPKQVAAFAGRYYSEELDMTYTIIPQGDKLLFRTGNWGDFLLSPRFVDSFANLEEMGSLMFTRDSKNRVSGFVIRSGKVRNLRFNKIK